MKKSAISWRRMDAHWLLSALAFLGLLAYTQFSRTPHSIDWPVFATMYWMYCLNLTLRAIVVAAILYGIQFPEAFEQCWKRYRREPLRLLAQLAIFIWMTFFVDILSAISVTSASIAIAEFFEVRKFSFDEIRRPIWNLVPATNYFFIGVTMVFIYNDIIARTRPFHDDAARRIDSFLLLGSSVPSLVHRMPRFLFPVADAVYWGFGEVGAVILLMAILRGRSEAFRCAGALLTAYYFGLVIFYIWPVLGPFDHPGHFHSLPSIGSFDIQLATIERLKAVRQLPGLKINPDYFIGFPSMHIAHPVVGWFFLRPWKRIARIIMTYNVLLVFAILALEWHYAIDIVGGILVAILAVHCAFQRKSRSKFVARQTGNENELVYVDLR
jgi:PAP2 superfamily